MRLSFFPCLGISRLWGEGSFDLGVAYCYHVCCFYLLCCRWGRFTVLRPTGSCDGMASILRTQPRRLLGNHVPVRPLLLLVCLQHIL